MLTVVIVVVVGVNGMVWDTVVPKRYNLIGFREKKNTPQYDTCVYSICTIIT